MFDKDLYFNGWRTLVLVNLSYVVMTRVVKLFVYGLLTTS